MKLLLQTMDSSLKSEAGPRRAAPQNLYVSFTGIRGKTEVKHERVVFQGSGARNEFSRVVSLNESGDFSRPIECCLRLGKRHGFIIHQFDARRALRYQRGGGRNSRKDDVVSLQFSLNVDSVVNRLARSSSERIRDTVALSDGRKVCFEASLVEPIDAEAGSASAASGDTECISVGPLPLASGASSSRGDVSFSSVSEDDYMLDEARSDVLSTSSRDRARRPQRVRFEREIHTIPTTQQLEKDIQQAVEERHTLSQVVGDLSVQLFQMKHEMRDVKESIRQITNLVSSHAEKVNAHLEKDSEASSAKRRRVVLDGDSIAASYRDRKFPLEGVEIALDYYRNNDVNVVAVVSQRLLSEDGEYGPNNLNKDRLRQLIDRGLVAVTPSRSKRGNFILKYALDHNADIVTNENFRSALEHFKSKTDERRLQSFLANHKVPFMFIADKFVPHSNSEPSSTSVSHKSFGRSDTM